MLLLVLRILRQDAAESDLCTALLGGAERPAVEGDFFLILFGGIGAGLEGIIGAGLEGTIGAGLEGNALSCQTVVVEVVGCLLLPPDTVLERGLVTGQGSGPPSEVHPFRSS